jgi:PqqA peptide cyclase
MNDKSPTQHVKEETVTIDAGELRSDAPDAAEDNLACARAPVGLLAELTHRCPLQCPYCSNPVELERVNTELATEDWQRVMREAAALGILQIHLSGGEPTARRDLVDIVKTAADCGLYTNLITAAVLLKREQLEALKEAGLDHVQISIQDVDAQAENADRIGGYKGGSAKKKIVAGWVRELGLPLTINAPIHRHNVYNVSNIIDYAVSLGAGRVEIAHVQYYAWALKNRASLMPTREEFMASAKIVERKREELKGVIVIDSVVPDYYAKYPKPCMGGWGRGIINVTPSGRVLPCHAAETIKGLEFDNVRDKPLGEIWLNGSAFQQYRGTSWMKEPCRSCPRKEIDYGGCRCQAFALTGDAANTDPACSLSPLHEQWAQVAEIESHKTPPEFTYRRPGGASPKTAKGKVPAPSDA